MTDLSIKSVVEEMFDCWLQFMATEARNLLSALAVIHTVRENGASAHSPGVTEP